MSYNDTANEIRELARQAEQLSSELRSVADSLRSRTVYQRVRFWALMMAGMAFTIGLVLLIGGQRRISASAYFLVADIGHNVWGWTFIACAMFTVACAWKVHRCLRWALLAESVPFVGLAASFAIASWRYPEANLTAAPVYLWISVAHGFLSDFARREF